MRPLGWSLARMDKVKDVFNILRERLIERRRLEGQGVRGR